MTNTNPLDPNFWEALGITPIQIDPNNPQSIEEGGEKIANRISEFLKQESQTPPSNSTDNSPK